MAKHMIEKVHESLKELPMDDLIAISYLVSMEMCARKGWTKGELKVG